MRSFFLLLFIFIFLGFQRSSTVVESLIKTDVGKKTHARNIISRYLSCLNDVLKTYSKR